MLRITNGEKTLLVAEKVYENTFKPMGWEPEDKEEAVQETIEKDGEDIENPERTEDELFVEKVLEKPLSEWSKEEVKKFAGIKDIELKGTKSAAEAKNRIRAFLENESDEDEKEEEVTE